MRIDQLTPGDTFVRNGQHGILERVSAGSVTVKLVKPGRVFTATKRGVGKHEVRIPQTYSHITWSPATPVERT